MRRDFEKLFAHFESPEPPAGLFNKIMASIREIVKGRDDVEKTVLVSNKTKISNRRETVKTSELKVDDQIVIIGSPDEQGQIEAKLIRLFR